MISGGGAAAGIPFAEETGKRVAERFRLIEEPCRHIAGILLIRTYLVPEYGLTQVAVFARNPIGTEVDVELLKRGFPTLVLWGASEESKS